VVAPVVVELLVQAAAAEVGQEFILEPLTMQLPAPAPVAVDQMKEPPMMLIHQAVDHNQMELTEQV
jgi:hypothetical protein